MKYLAYSPVIFFIWFALIFLRDPDSRNAVGQDGRTRISTTFMLASSEKKNDQSTQIPASEHADVSDGNRQRSRWKPKKKRLIASSSWFVEQLLQGFVWVWSWALMLYFALCALFVLGVTILLGAVLLPYFPQELGGAKPRCLTLDVETKKISPELTQILFESSTSPISHEVRRTRELDVYFSNNESVIIRLQQNSKTPARTLEIKRAAVVATLSCP